MCAQILRKSSKEFIYLIIYRNNKIGSSLNYFSYCYPLPVTDRVFASFPDLVYNFWLILNCVCWHRSKIVVVFQERLSSFPIWESALFDVSCKTTALIQGTGFVISLCRWLPKTRTHLFTRNTTSVYVRQMQRGGKMPPPL